MELNTAREALVNKRKLLLIGQATMQASADSFAHTPLGHAFVLRKPLAKATANLCANADCGCDIRAHARAEVECNGAFGRKPPP